jgi:hypothetical protein
MVCSCVCLYDDEIYQGTVLCLLFFSFAHYIDDSVLIGRTICWVYLISNRFVRMLIEADKLFIFNSENDLEHLEFIDLSKVETVQPVENAYGTTDEEMHGFKIETTDKKKHFFLANSNKAMWFWVSGIVKWVNHISRAFIGEKPATIDLQQLRRASSVRGGATAATTAAAAAAATSSSANNDDAQQRAASANNAVTTVTTTSASGGKDEPSRTTPATASVRKTTTTPSTITSATTVTSSSGGSARRVAFKAGPMETVMLRPSDEVLLLLFSSLLLSRSYLEFTRE